MVEMGIKVDLSVFERRMAHIYRQIPYAIKVALDIALFQARADVFEELPDFFATRTEFMRRGLHIDRPTKQNLTGRLGFLPTRWFMESQVTGDDRRVKPGNKKSWMPIETGERSPRPVHGERIIPSRRPNVAFAKNTGKKRRPSRGGGVINASKYFPLLKSKGLYPGIYYREAGEGRKLTPAYWLEPFMKVEARYPMQERVQASVDRTWPRAVEGGIKRAIETAR